VIIYTTNETDIDAITSYIDTAAGYPIVIKEGKQATERWAIKKKAINDDIWWIEKPDASLLDGCPTAYSEQAAPDASWLPDPEV